MTASLGRLDLTRSQSETQLVTAMIEHDFVVASWRGGEPIIHGFGITLYQAVNMARKCGAPENSEVCIRFDPTNRYVWRSPSGKYLNVEHFLTLDN